MKILLDEDVPRPLRRHLRDHDVITVQEMDWAGITNGKLLTLAEGQNFGVLLTCDQNLQYQQNLAGRNIAVVTLIVLNKRMETLLPLVPDLLALLLSIHPGSFYRVEPPQADNTVDTQ